MKGKFDAKLIPALIGGSVLCFMGLLILFSPKSDYSVTRGKSLSSLPQATLSGVLNQTTQSSLETYVEEHFPLRDLLAPVANRMAAFLDLGQVDQVYLLETRQVEQVIGSAAAAQPAIDAIFGFLSRQSNSVIGLVPSAWTVYQDQLPSTPDLLDEGQLMADAYNVLDKTRTIDLYSVLTSAQSENLYYTTDNRLTGYGSYLCYRSLIRALGQSSLGLESFDIRHVANGIYGNLYRRTMIPTGPGDTLDEYRSQTGGKVTEMDLQYDGYTAQSQSLYFPEYLNTGDPMSYYLGSGWGVADISTDSAGERSLLLITDDFSNPIVPFLTLHYRQVTVVHLSDATQEQLANLHPEKYTSTLLLFSIQQLTSGSEFATRLRMIGTAS